MSRWVVGSILLAVLLFPATARGQTGACCYLVAGAYLEAEACGSTTNDGCNITPAYFETIPFPATNPLTICGSARTFMEGATERRDTDWYKFTLTGSVARTVTVTDQAAKNRYRSC